MSNEDAISREIAAVRLMQVKDLATELLEWIESLNEEEFLAMWNGEECIPNEHFTKAERLADVADVIREALKAKLACAMVA